MNAKAIMKYFSLMIAVFSIFASVSGCSLLPNFGGLSGKKGLDSSTYKNALPSDFEGPYADEFADAIKTNQTDFIYSILKDSKITDQEFLETENILTQCYKGYGLSTKFATDPIMLGSYVVVIPGADGNGNGGTAPRNMNEVVSNCNSKSDYIDIATLYYKIMINPNREDLSNYSAQCLIKVGYENQGYTEEQFREDFLNNPALVTQFSLGNADSVPGGKVVINKGDSSSDQDFADAIAGKPTKNTIGLYDLNKCLLNPKSVLSEK
jgi:hypothetical protein